MAEDRNPHDDDIAHLDFDVEDPELAARLEALEEPEASGDPRRWSPTEDVDDGTWVLSDEDKLLQQQLEWRRYRRGRLFRVAAAVVVVALLALSLSTLIGRLTSNGDGSQRPIDPERIDAGPTSSEMAGYLPSDAAVRALDASLALVPGNTDGGEGGSYVNLSLEELDEGGPAVPTHGAGAGVIRQWASADGARHVMAGLILFPDRPAAAGAADKVLGIAAAEGAPSQPAGRFTLAGPSGDATEQTWVAVRSIGRFLVTIQTIGIEEPTTRSLVQATDAATAAVH